MRRKLKRISSFFNIIPIQIILQSFLPTLNLTFLTINLHRPPLLLISLAHHSQGGRGRLSKQMLPYPSPPLFTVTRVPNALMRRNNMVIKVAYDSSQILEPLFSVRPINRPVTLGAVPRSNRIDPSSSSFLSLSFLSRGDRATTL